MFIKEYAQMFTLDPDDVYLKEFDTVVAFLATARREQELEDRVAEIRKGRS